MFGEHDDVKSLIDNLRAEAASFEEEFEEAHSGALRLHKEFLAKFPFAQYPSSIDSLTETDVYNPGSI